MRKKYQIEILQDGKCVETIKASLKGVAIGNFNPFFARYKGKDHLVQSKEGDLSDVLRREESYLDTLYIELPKENEA